jgi:hypothetical protein
MPAGHRQLMDRYNIRRYEAENGREENMKNYSRDAWERPAQIR